MIRSYNEATDSDGMMMLCERGVFFGVEEEIERSVAAQEDPAANSLETTLVYVEGNRLLGSIAITGDGEVVSPICVVGVEEERPEIIDRLWAHAGAHSERLIRRGQRAALAQLAGAAGLIAFIGIVPNLH